MDTRARYGILALITAGTTINYLDRGILGIAAPSLSRDLHVDAATMGLIFSAFSWSYAAAQIPAGAALDRVGSKIAYLVSLVAWSVVTLLHSVAGSVAALFGLRLALGVAESPCFPTNSRVVATWFPRAERAFATGIYTVGEYVGFAFLSPLLALMMTAWGWQAMFVFSGGVGLAFAVAWARFYREPSDATASGTVDGERFAWRNVVALFRHRQMWGICLGQFAVTSTLNFFLTWFPSYLASERRMDFLKVGWFAALPYIAASVGVLVGGFWSDAMLRRGVSPTVARKLPVITGLLFASSIVAANAVDSDAAIIGIMSVAFFAQGMSGISWTLVADIAPPGLLGLTGGLFNFAGNASGIITPIVIGAIISRTGSYVYALAFIGALAVAGAFAYIVVLGEVRRLEVR